MLFLAAQQSAELRLNLMSRLETLALAALLLAQPAAGLKRRVHPLAKECLQGRLVERIRLALEPVA